MRVFNGVARIIPQAVCSKYGLAVGAHTAWIVKILMFVLFPITWPIARILKFIVGEHEGTIYHRNELKEFVALHAARERGDLADDEVKIIRSVLDLKHKTIQDVLTPLSETFVLNMETLLDAESLLLIQSAGYSRIPIYVGDKHNIVGVVLVKDLVGVDPDEGKKIRDLRYLMRPILYFSVSDSLLTVMHRFLDAKGHIGAVFAPEIVINHPSSLESLRSSSSSIVTSLDSGSSDEADLAPAGLLLGIVTLEDVFEELIGEDIVDETDLYVNRKRKEENLYRPTAPYATLRTRIHHFKVKKQRLRHHGLHARSRRTKSGVRSRSPRKSEEQQKHYSSSWQPSPSNAWSESHSTLDQNTGVTAELEVETLLPQQNDEKTAPV